MNVVEPGQTNDVLCIGKNVIRENILFHHKLIAHKIHNKSKCGENELGSKVGGFIALSHLFERDRKLTYK